MVKKRLAKVKNPLKRARIDWVFFGLVIAALVMAVGLYSFSYNSDVEMSPIGGVDIKVYVNASSALGNQIMLVGARVLAFAVDPSNGNILKDFASGTVGPDGYATLHVVNQPLQYLSGNNYVYVNNPDIYIGASGYKLANGAIFGYDSLTPPAKVNFNGNVAQDVKIVLSSPAWYKETMSIKYSNAVQRCPVAGANVNLVDVNSLPLVQQMPSAGIMYANPGILGVNINAVTDSYGFASFENTPLPRFDIYGRTAMYYAKVTEGGGLANPYIKVNLGIDKSSFNFDFCPTKNPDPTCWSRGGNI